MVITCTDCKTRLKTKIDSANPLRAFGWFAYEHPLAISKHQKEKAVKRLYRYRCPCCSLDRAFGAIEGN